MTNIIEKNKVYKISDEYVKKKDTRDSINDTNKLRTENVTHTEGTTGEDTTKKKVKRSITNLGDSTIKNI